MKKLIALIASVVMLGSIVRADVGVNAGYTSKLVEFGTVTTAKSVYTAGADASWQSFNFSVLSYNSLEVNPFSAKLSRVDLTTGYTFFSTLANATVGGTYIHFNNPGKFDFTGHWRPFASIGKDFWLVSGAYDTQSRLSNLEGKLYHAVPMGYGFNLVPSVYAGYTDVQDTLPKTVKAIKTNLGYAGATLGVNYKWLTVGGFYVRNLKDIKDSRNTTGWQTSAAYRF